jgi:Histidine kinase-, DNA gyrase B-, and HSP90-like ATPase
MPDTEDTELAHQIAASHNNDEIVRTTLQADGRVLARVTDGIYRQPGSALRELISNAYDADAGRVIITTDRPRFDRITVEDDGAGMSPDAIVHLLRHIGGSAKRSPEGIGLGVTGSDVNLSPRGRRLIGKIGIGLFSIAQLTQTFQIITKTSGDSWRTVASVILKQYSDEQLADSEGTYEAGLVSIWQEPASDIDAHGTTVVLDGIRPKTKETLQSAGDWLRIERGQADLPKFHIGHYRSSDSGDELRRDDGKFESVPWAKHDDPSLAFRKLVDAVWDELDKGDRNPRLDNMFDYYLFMVWSLA